MPTPKRVTAKSRKPAPKPAARAAAAAREVKLSKGVTFSVAPVARGAVMRALVTPVDPWEKVQALANVYFVLGTELKPPLPKGIAGPDDSSWEEELALAGLEVAKDGRARYRDWLTMYVLKDPDDWRTLFFGVMMASGGMEPELRRAFAEVVRIAGDGTIVPPAGG